MCPGDRNFAPDKNFFPPRESKRGGDAGKRDAGNHGGEFVGPVSEFVGASKRRGGGMARQFVRAEFGGSMGLESSIDRRRGRAGTGGTGRGGGGAGGGGRGHGVAGKDAGGTGGEWEGAGGGAPERGEIVLAYPEWGYMAGVSLREAQVRLRLFLGVSRCC